MASAYVRQAPSMNGFEAYYTLHDGYVFAGSTTSTLLLNELSNFRFLPNETPTALVLRLEELFQELELLPSEAAITFVDTQKIGYLLSGIRQERQLQAVYVSLQDKQVRGAITFEEACDDLHHRCEAIRADNLLDSRFRPTGRALISTEIKHLDKEKLPCLAKGCEGMIVAFMPYFFQHQHRGRLSTPFFSLLYLHDFFPIF
jgi:hypothetical protein